ncbi:MAG: S8/S53 family peptidase [Planctomycetes bacterium]|nr:S8/S53 family peptidase [Planctomycetota bacterium]
MLAHQKSFCDSISDLGGRVTHQWWLVNGCCIEIDSQHLDAIRKMPNVARLEPNLLISPQLLKATDANNHNSDSLRLKGVTGVGVACALIDTGQDSDMNGTKVPHIIYSRDGSSSRTRLVKNMQIGKMPADDVNGHGTAVASIAAGWRSYSADYGHACGASIVGYAIADTTTGDSCIANVVSGYQHAAADAAEFRIVTTNVSYDGDEDAVGIAALAQDSAALNADLLNATAASNYGSNVANGLPNINGVSVGAVEANTHVLADFSSRGVQGGRLFPNLCANGVTVLAALRDYESHLYAGSGTSIASPMVCGGATLIRGANTALKSDETRAILLASTDKNPGSGGGLNSTGTGAGYLRIDRAYDVAMNPGMHGRETLDVTTTTWSMPIAVVVTKTIQIGIAWHRLDLSSSGKTWSNLDLELRRGSTVLASSKTSFNTEEFLRYVPEATETLTIHVQLNGSVIGSTAQAFGWATWLDTSKSPGEYDTFGSGCKGSGFSTRVGLPVLPPGGYDSAYGNETESIPFGNIYDSRFMQSHGSGDIVDGMRIDGFRFRVAPKYPQIKCTRDLELRIGYTSKPAAAISQFFDTNWSGTPTKVFSGKLDVPGFAAQTDPKVWTLEVPFSAPFVYRRAQGNLLWEATAGVPYPDNWTKFDAVYHRDLDGAMVIGYKANATSGSEKPNSVLITQLMTPRVRGADVILTNSGVPEIGTGFDVVLWDAPEFALAILWVGTSQYDLSLGAIAPGCSLYANIDAILGAVVTDAGGVGSVMISVPNFGGLLGAKFYNQYMVLDPSANALGLTLSNGGVGRIGG